MPTKTLSISDEAYHRLKRLKASKESFSDVINRLSGRPDFRRYAGSIPGAMADELQDAASDVRRRFEQGRSRTP